MGGAVHVDIQVPTLVRSVLLVRQLRIRGHGEDRVGCLGQRNNDRPVGASSAVAMTVIQNERCMALLPSFIDSQALICKGQYSQKRP